MIVQCPECRSRYRFDEGRLPGGGSASLTCPRCRSPFTVHGPAPAAPRASAAGSGRTALLADQARELRDEAQKVLEEEGYEVSVTDNGEEALLLAGNHRFDLILLNVYLRRVPGIQFCQRIKKHPELRSIPVMLFGTSMTPEDPESDSGPAYGADEFIPTRLGREELRRRIRRAGGQPTPAAARTESSGVDGLAPGGPPPEEKAPSSGESQSAEESEIRRLARIMISDIQMYHPEKFGRALRDGTFFEAFAEELGKGKQIIDQRFGHLANRIPLLAAGIRDTLESLRPSGRRRSAAGE